MIVGRPTNGTSNCYCTALNVDSNFYVFLLYTALETIINVKNERSVVINIHAHLELVGLQGMNNE